MRYDICLLRLQFKKQKLFYILPILFVYLFLLPYQRQVFSSGRSMEEILREIFSLNQKYLILFGLWYLFLCFRMMLGDEIKELGWCLDSKYRFRWIFYWEAVYIVLLTPYIIWSLSHIPGYEENMFTVIFQILCFGCIMYFFLQITGSSFLSLSIMLVYCFLCFYHFIPDGINGIRSHELAGQIEGSWYLLQAGGGTAFLIVGEAVGRCGHFRVKA